MHQRPELDRWIISLLNSLIKEVGESYENYEPTRAGRFISDFVTENLSNWFVRRSRRRDQEHPLRLVKGSVLQAD